MGSGVGVGVGVGVGEGVGVGVGDGVVLGVPHPRLIISETSTSITTLIKYCFFTSTLLHHIFLLDGIFHVMTSPSSGIDFDM